MHPFLHIYAWQIDSTKINKQNKNIWHKWSELETNIYPKIKAIPDQKKSREVGLSRI